MKKILLAIAALLLCATGIVAQQPGPDDSQQWKASLPPVNARFAADSTQQLPADFRQGAFILNEGWFGHDPGSVSFLDDKDSVYYNVYQQLNPGHSFGNTAQYGTIYGNHFFAVSKQNYSGSQGGRLVMASADSLRMQGQILAFPDGDGRTFCAVSEEKGYIGTSTGLFAVDLRTMACGEKQLGRVTADKGYKRQCMEMVYFNKRLFAPQKDIGVLVVNPENDSVQLIEMPKVATIFVSAAGTLYAATTDVNAEFISIDPGTLALDTVDIPGSHCVILPGTYHRISLVPDTRTNAVYYVSKSGNISQYNFDTKAFEESIYAVQGQEIFYGAAINYDPKSGYLLLNTTEKGFGTHYQQNWVHFFDPATRTVTKTVKLSEYYWFPSMMLFPDFQAPVLTAEKVSMKPGETKELSLTDLVGKPFVGNLHLIDWTLTSSDTTLLKVSDNLGVATLVAGPKSGNVTLHISGSFLGRVGSLDLTVAVAMEIPDAFTTGGIKYKVTSKSEPMQVQVVGPESTDITSLDIRGQVVYDDFTFDVVSIGNSAFKGCTKLTTAVISDSVTSFEYGTFLDCSALSSVTLPAGLTALPRSMFTNCKALKSIKLPAKLTKIDNAAFSNCSALDSIEIPATVTTMGSSVFMNCTSLRELILPDAVATIGAYMCKGCNNLATIYLGTSLKAIPNYVFQDCKALQKPQIPATVTSIGIGVFQGAGLVSIHIPDAVRSLGNFIFKDCKSLQRVYLGTGLTTIGKDALVGCTAMTTITCLGTTPANVASALGESALYTQTTLYVPESAMQAYKDHSEWKKFTTILKYVDTGVDGIDADEILSSDYYTLTGQRIANPAPGTIVIRVDRLASGRTLTRKVIGR